MIMTMTREEIDKNKSILASMFDSYDFDKPIELEETGNEIHGSGGGKVATAADDDDEIEVDSKGRRKQNITIMRLKENIRG